MRRPGSLLTWSSLFFILAAVILFILQLVGYSRVRTQFPRGLVIAGVPVGELDRQESAGRLLEVYSTPVELVYGEARIQLNPAVVGFELNMEGMLAAADLERTQNSFWEGFWDYLWGRQTNPSRIPLSASYSEDRLRTYLLEDVASRYDIPALPPQPAVGTVNFIPGLPGTTMNADEAVVLIENAMLSPSQRTVSIPLTRTFPPRLAFENLRFFITQTIDRENFEGLVGFYLLDLETAREIHFGYQAGNFLSTEPDIAFTAASIIKIPIMVSIYSRLEGDSDAEAQKLLVDMIELSGNDPADWVMERVIDTNFGPLGVTDDMQALGLENTFLAGQFYPGAPLLFASETPANQRIDVNTNPDLYNQTTASDMGMLLTDIYLCAQSYGGSLVTVFPNQISREECGQMLSSLSRNKIQVLIEAGVPEGTQIAHKHGWVTNSAGVINTIGDAGIVYTPGGNYVLVVFMYDPVQLVWDPASRLIAQISQAVYNYYNLSSP